MIEAFLFGMRKIFRRIFHSPVLAWRRFQIIPKIRAVAEAFFHAGPGEHRRVAARPVVTARDLRSAETDLRRAPELADEHHERVVQ